MNTITAASCGTCHYACACREAKHKVEVDQLRAECERLKANLSCVGIHTCHEKCENPFCLTRKERDSLAEKLREAEKENKELHAEATKIANSAAKARLEERENCAALVIQLGAQGPQLGCVSREVASIAAAIRGEK